ncbi:hypothetical protein ACWCPQ_06200 [Nocardia sp. NPDC001965]
MGDSNSGEIPAGGINAGEWVYSKNRQYRFGIENGRIVLQSMAGGDGVTIKDFDTPAESFRFREEEGGKEHGKHANEIMVTPPGGKERPWVNESQHVGHGNGEQWAEGYDEGGDFHRVGAYFLTNEGNIVGLDSSVADDQFLAGWDGSHDPAAGPAALWYMFTPEELSDLRRAESAKKLESVGSNGRIDALRIVLPPGEYTETFKAFVRVSEKQIKQLGWQLGTGNFWLPDHFKDYETANQHQPDLHTVDNQALDNNLSPAVLEPLIKGETGDAAGALYSRLVAAETEWAKKDPEFAGKVIELQGLNRAAFLALTTALLNLNDSLAFSAMGRQIKGPKFTSAGNDGDTLSVDGAPLSKFTTAWSEVYPGGSENLRLPGVLDAREERPMYPLIQGTIENCMRIVRDYAKNAEMNGQAIKPPAPPTTGSPATGSPATGSPATGSPATGSPATGSPATGSPATGSPATGSPATGSPATGSPATGSPATGSPATGSPATSNDPAAARSGSSGTGAQDGSRPVTAVAARNEDDEELSAILGDSAEQVGDKAATDGAGAPDETRAGSPPGQGSAPAENSGGATQATVPSAQLPATPSGADAMSSMMPAMLMSSLMGRTSNLPGDERSEQADRDERDRRPSGPDRPPSEVTPEAPRAAEPVHPGAAPPATTEVPPSVDIAGGAVDYKLPDNSMVKVPQGVAEALSRQQGNPAIDATVAYADTPAAQTDEKPWSVVDPSQLRTGDVVSWEKHSAIVVTNGDGPHYVDGGRLVPLGPHNQDHAQYGRFINYLHPTGLDVGAPAAPTPVPTELPAPTVDRSRPPVVQAPPA